VILEELGAHGAEPVPGNPGPDHGEKVSSPVSTAAQAAPEERHACHAVVKHECGSGDHQPQVMGGARQGLVMPTGTQSAGPAPGIAAPRPGSRRRRGRPVPQHGFEAAGRAGVE
jgi:hypothetical protein